MWDTLLWLYYYPADQIIAKLQENFPALMRLSPPEATALYLTFLAAFVWIVVLYLVMKLKNLLFGHNQRNPADRFVGRKRNVDVRTSWFALLLIVALILMALLGLTKLLFS